MSDFFRKDQIFRAHPEPVESPGSPESYMSHFQNGGPVNNSFFSLIDVLYNYAHIYIYKLQLHRVHVFFWDVFSISNLTLICYFYSFFKGCPSVWLWFFAPQASAFTTCWGCWPHRAGTKMNNFLPMWFLGSMWVFPTIGVPQNGWFVMENHIKMDDWGVPLFSETSMSVSKTLGL